MQNHSRTESNRVFVAESARSEPESTPQAKRRKTTQDEQNIEIESTSIAQPSSNVAETKDEKSVNIDETSQSETSAKPVEGNSALKI